ncbi:MAG: hypothetical protein JWL96_1154 [Sphingomonas bacterium]|nr:hypothetical protein [Sphingomonas bacterium]
MSRKSNRLMLLGAMASGTLLLAGCATETAYRPATGTGFARVGYSDHQVEANRFEVTFSGNSYTSRDTVEKYLLYRAAELTLQQGGDYFIMADRNTDHSSRSYTTPGIGGPGYGYGGWGGYWGPSWRYFGRGYGWRSWDPFFGDPFWDRNVDIQTVDKYEATAEIIIGRGPKPRDNVRAFDAKEVIAHIGPSVVMPK